MKLSTFHPLFKTRLSQFALAAATLTLLSACGGGDTAATRVVNLDFAAVAGNTVVQCGDTFTGVGTTGASATLKDARFYVSNIYLIRIDGSEQRFIPDASTDEQKKWNHADGTNSVSLIDLENATSGCQSDEKTSAETNTRLTATVPNDLYTGVRFEVGVPFALNHTNALSDATPKPLQSTPMAWSWQGGRKFTKIEIGPASGTTWSIPVFNFHLGSTGCTGEDPSNGKISSCSNPNRMTVPLKSFNPDTQKIALDLKALFAGVDVTKNAGGSAGCMSFQGDPECPALFDALQVDFTAGKGTPINGGAAQRVFKAINR